MRRRLAASRLRGRYWEIYGSPRKENYLANVEPAPAITINSRASRVVHRPGPADVIEVEWECPHCGAAGYAEIVRANPGLVMCAVCKQDAIEVEGSARRPIYRPSMWRWP